MFKIRIARIEFAIPVVNSQGVRLLCFVKGVFNSQQVSLRIRIAAHVLQVATI